MPQITVSNEAHAQIQDFATRAGITIEKASSDAILEWMDTTGVSILYGLEERRRKHQAQQRKAS